VLPFLFFDSVALQLCNSCSEVVRHLRAATERGLEFARAAQAQQKVGSGMQQHAPPPFKQLT
jgi:hypothetical protein